MDFILAIWFWFLISIPISLLLARFIAFGGRD